MSDSIVRRIVNISVLLTSVAVFVAVLWISLSIVRKHRRVTILGAVVRQDTDPNKQAPIAGVRVTAITGTTESATNSDQLGQFSLTLPKGFRRRQAITLDFQHADYQPLTMRDFIGDKLYIAQLTPLNKSARHDDNRAETAVANLRVRYLVKTTTTSDIGSAVRTFQVINTGNLPCKGNPPCSPDGKWRANIAATQLDAGEGSEFRNIRVSCIAGPCPFTKIEREVITNDGRQLDISARAWSDTATFLIEAEVVRTMVSDLVRESYPVIFGPSLSFSLPVAAEGPSLEAEINGEPIVFPLGPSLSLSWGECTLSHNKDQTTVYHCELKAGYRFK